MTASEVRRTLGGSLSPTVGSGGRLRPRPRCGTVCSGTSSPTSTPSKRSSFSRNSSHSRSFSKGCDPGLWDRDRLGVLNTESTVLLRRLRGAEAWSGSPTDEDEPPGGGSPPAASAARRAARVCSARRSTSRRRRSRSTSRRDAACSERASATEADWEWVEDRVDVRLVLLRRPPTEAAPRTRWCARLPRTSLRWTEAEPKLRRKVREVPPPSG